MPEFLLDTLYKKSKNGKVTQWEIKVVEKEHPTLVMTSGYVDGQKTITERTIAKGTNVGRANEKTPWENACFQAQARWTKKQEEGFSTDINNLKTLPTPMLAKAFDASEVEFPCYVQPKFNGIRCTMYRHLGDPRFLSRALKEFTTLEFMRDEVNMFINYSPDGEIYLHGTPLQDIVSLLKRKQEGTEFLKYVIYDLAIPDKTFEQRLKILQWVFENETKLYGHPNHIELAPTYKVDCLEDIQYLYKKLTKEGYEGVIIRNPNAPYRFSDRTSDLMKYKDFKDAEFKIVGFETERYFDKSAKVYRNLVVWVCANEMGEQFNVRPVGNAIEREQIHSHAEDYIGKNLTVRYLELSKKGVPIGNPVGLAIRDYE